MRLRVPFPVRLVNHGVLNKTAGRLEVFENGKWGIVCDNYVTGMNDGGSTSDQVGKVLKGSRFSKFGFIRLLSYNECNL